MNVSCPDCQSVFRLDPAKVVSERMRARCSVCGGIIPVGTGASWSDTFADVPQRVATPRAVRQEMSPISASGGSPAVPNERSTPTGNQPVLPGEEGRVAASARSDVAKPTPVRVHAVMESAPPQAPVPAAPVAIESALPSAPALPQPSVATPTEAAVDRVSMLDPAVPRPFVPPVITLTSAPPSSATPAVATPGTPARSAPIVPGRPTPIGHDRSSLATPRRLTPIGGNPSYHRGPTRPASPAFGAPLSPPPRTSIPTPVATPVVPSSGEPFEPTSTRRPINPFLANDPNQKARRLARALVSDMVAYHPAKREDGLRNGTLKQLFREEIKKSYEEYVEQIGREFAEATTHFQDALNDVLSGGRKLF